jgi:hypothetical protein
MGSKLFETGRAIERLGSWESLLDSSDFVLFWRVRCERGRISVHLNVNAFVFSESRMAICHKRMFCCISTLTFQVSLMKFAQITFFLFLGSVQSRCLKPTASPTHPHIPS